MPRFEKEKETVKEFESLRGHKFERAFPTIAGVVGVIIITLVTWLFNLDRGQTWLPLTEF